MSMTIKQLHAVTQTQADGDFKIDGQDLGQITFIATVRSINRQSTQHTYTVEDGTGNIDAKRFPSEDEDTAELNTIVEGTCVRIVGLLKQFNQRFSVNIHTIRPIQDMNELTYHNLEVIYVHVSLTRPKTDGTGLSNAGMASHTNFSGQNTAGAGGMGTSTIQQQIAEVIHNHPARSTGVHRREVIARFAPVVGGADAANEVIDNMIADGFLYPADDEDHLMISY
ncbi:replication factor A protein 2 [Dissophora ornata]|nr:replication factor A protein 2 [Dissophora ornata]